METRIKSLQSQIALVETQNEELALIKLEQSKQLIELEKINIDLERQNDSQKIKLDSLLKENNILSENNENIKRDHELKLKQLKDELAEITEQNRHLNDDLYKYKHESMNLTQIIEDNKAKYRKTENELEELTDKVKKEHTVKSNLENDFDQALIENKQLKHLKYEQEDSINMLQNELERLKTRLSSEEKENAQLRERLTSYNEKFSKTLGEFRLKEDEYYEKSRKTEVELDQLIRSNSSLQNENDILQKQIAEAESRIES
mmetsp:Transcript_99127/g.213937  ORF Transcript_99127/g.213937 Transcript_99127/m.213937 type:complete len:261 (-) Transcript_99127:428-1210(-)